MTFPRDSLNKLEVAALQPGRQELELSMTITLSNTSRFHEAMENAKRIFSASGRQ
jgi:hypothetical protein